jgi:hypothetical protein
MRKGILSLVVCFVALTTGLLAKDYEVDTGNPDIVASLRTLTKAKMLKLTGNYGEYKVDTETFHTTSAGIGGSWFGFGGGVQDSMGVRRKVTNLLLEASERFMTVILKVQNNSSDTIMLPKGEFIENLEDYHIGIDALDRLYKQMIGIDYRNRTEAYVYSGGLAILGLLWGAYEFYFSRYLGLSFYSLIGMPLCFVGSGISLYVGYQHGCAAGEKTRKNKEIMEYTKINGKVREGNSSYYKIPSGGSAVVLFLVDLKEDGSDGKCGRNIFTRQSPVLCYKVRASRSSRPQED